MEGGRNHSGGGGNRKSDRSLSGKELQWGLGSMGGSGGDWDRWRWDLGPEVGCALLRRLRACTAGHTARSSQHLPVPAPTSLWQN